MQLYCIRDACDNDGVAVKGRQIIILAQLESKALDQLHMDIEDKQGSWNETVYTA